MRLQSDHPLRLAILAGLTSLAMLAQTPANAQKKYDPGASDTEIKIGQTMPFSGPASAYATISKAEAAYFKMINDQGGINGRKIDLIAYDDAYSPPKTVEQIRRLVESDEVLFIFQSLGSAHNAAVQKYLNTKKVPQLFTATGASRFMDPKNFPWTMGFNGGFQIEARIYARYILANYPNAKVGVLYQNDDFGKDYLTGLKDGFGARAAAMIVAEAPYEATDPTIDSQIINLKLAGTDVLVDLTTPKFAVQAIKKAAELSWRPVHIINVNSTSVGVVMMVAGSEKAKDSISAIYGKDPLDPTWKDDPGVKKWLAFMEKYYPGGDKTSNFNSYGYGAAQLLVRVLEQCGDDLTRENVMRQATNLNKVTLDMMLPGTSITTSPTDYRVYKQFQMMRFTGERWELFGPIITDDSKS
jgi:branched-chain amino acid transport system substrate-binding protein